MKIRRICSFFVVLFMTILLSSEVFAQSITIDAGEHLSGSATSRIFNLIVVITVLSIAPSILIMTTSFTRIIVVLSIARSALATSSTPPNMVLISLALFLTMFVMAPTLEKSWEEGIKPMYEDKMDMTEGLEKASDPVKQFMLRNTREKDLMLFSDLAEVKNIENFEEIPLKVVIPSFMISELRRAFEIGFLIFLPFLVIDMVIASVLMSMGMMMLPPTVLALPFKIIFFVLIDGWYMLAGSLVRSFS